jgi:hypothetical protein
MKIVMGEQEDNEPETLDYSPPPPPTVPRYRKILSGVLLCVGVVVAVTGLFPKSEPARANICVTGCGVVIYGLVIRFQHVRV